MTNALEGQIIVAGLGTSRCLIFKVYLDVVVVACGILATVVFWTVWFASTERKEDSLKIESCGLTFTNYSL